jgi:SAM-dependent methyltransferase
MTQEPARDDQLPLSPDANLTLDFPLLEEADEEPEIEQLEIDLPETADSVDISMDEEEAGRPVPMIAEVVQAAPAASPPPVVTGMPEAAPRRAARAQTVALSDADLEELGDDELGTALPRARRISGAPSNGAPAEAEAPISAVIRDPAESGELLTDDMVEEVGARASRGAGDADSFNATVDLAAEDDDIEEVAEVEPDEVAAELAAPASTSQPQVAPPVAAPPPPPVAAPPPPPVAAPPPPPVAAPPPPPVAAPPPPPIAAPAAAPPAAPGAATSAPLVAMPPAAVPPAPPPVAKHKPPPAPAPAAAAAAVAAAADPTTKRKRRGKPWFEEIFDEDYLRTLPFLTPQATQTESQFVMESLGVAPGSQILDVGCGYGRHAMELAARGYHVVGLDSSLPLLLRGADEAQRRGLTINFVHGDMRDLAFESQFDGAYCLFSTFGYFDDETNKKAAANICRALKPGARCVFEVLNRDYVVADLPLRVWWEGDGCVVLEEVDFNYFSSRIQSSRSVVFDDGRQLEQEISIRSFCLHELGKLLHSVGFRVVEVSGSMSTKGRFFGAHSRDIVVVAERRVEKPGAPSAGDLSGRIS